MIAATRPNWTCAVRALALRQQVYTPSRPFSNGVSTLNPAQGGAKGSPSSDLKSFAAERDALASGLKTFITEQKTVLTDGLRRTQMELAQCQEDANVRRERYVSRILPGLQESQLLQGMVVKSCNSKTVAVRVPHPKMHPIILKPIMYHKRFQVHDEFEDCVVGDVVQIAPCNPYSKQKRHEVYKIVKAASRYTDPTDGKTYSERPNYTPDRYRVARKIAEIPASLNVN